MLDIPQINDPYEGSLDAAPEGSFVALCGKIAKIFNQHEALQGRHCVRPAGHDGCHFVQRDDETHAQTVERCMSKK